MLVLEEAVINSLMGVNIYLASFLIPHRRNRLLWRFEGNLLRRISHARVHLWSRSCFRYINIFSESRFGRGGRNV